MYILWIILAVVAVLLVALLAYVATRPNEFRITREIVIQAPPEAPFGYVNNLKAWDDWSPWAKLDPNMQMTYGDKTEGTGAWYEWTGNDKVGAGKLTITESRLSDSLRLKLEFLRPFKAVNDGDFTFKREGNSTRVIWGMDGKNNLMSKAMCLLINMDKLVGKDFEKGLNSLKTLAEGAA